MEPPHNEVLRELSAWPLVPRDLSWLQFNERVLGEAQPESGNLLSERLKFLAISASNLDEFFMIRVASLNRSLRRQLRQDPESPNARRLASVRHTLLRGVGNFVAKQQRALDMLAEELREHNVVLHRTPAFPDALLPLTESLFREKLFTQLGPPQPFEPSLLSQLENLKIAVVFGDQSWLRISRSLPSLLWVKHEGALHCFFQDHLVQRWVGEAFNLKTTPLLFRITRDADVTLDLEEEDPESIPDMVRTTIGHREKGGAVRLQHLGPWNFELEKMQTLLKLAPEQCFPVPSTLVLNGLWSLVSSIPELLPPSKAKAIVPNPLKPHVPRSFLQPKKIFEKLKAHDYLLHHPYDSFDAFVQWMSEACEDPQVECIEQTIYRMDALSPLIDLLKRAAKHKKVRVVIELRARFDELNNLRLTEELRKAGVEVAFGFGRLKLHAKVALVSRREEGQLRLYTHLSTGNYNSATARQYTDLAILTAHPGIGADARLFFDAIIEGKIPQGFKHLVSAPTRLHRRLLNHIENEKKAAQAGHPTRIVAKVNALVDDSVARALYEASQAGVKVDLIVRGACSLVPGVPGISDNIRVVSIVDRFLEHSRIYYFESQRALYFSSADWMPRNFFSRLEIAFPVLDPRIYAFVSEILFPTYFSDNSKASWLTPEGIWKKIEADLPGRVRSQSIFERLAKEEYRGTPLN